MDDPSGCTLTRTKFKPLTGDVIEAMGMTAYAEKLFSTMVEARAVGVVPNSFNELVMSRIGPAGGKFHSRTVGMTTQFAPFKYRHRKRNIKMSSFNVASGQATSGAGTGSIPARAWDIVVNIGPGEYASPLKNLARYFIPGMHVVVQHKNASTNVAYTTSAKIYASVDVDANSARVTILPLFSVAGWAALSSGEKLPHQPTFGVVDILANNVSDWESFAVNPPTNNTEELLVDWYQTSRETRIRNAEYEKYLAEIIQGNVNPYLQKFRTLPIAERNAQEMAYYEQLWINAIFHNARASEHQTTDPDWDDISNLEVVTDAETAGCEYERKANAIGIFTQLGENARKWDMQGAVLDFDFLAETLVRLQRNRQLDGKAHDTIDLGMSRFMKSKLDSLLIRYLKAEYGYEHQKQVSNDKIKDVNGMVMFDCTTYDLPRQGLRVALWTDRFFEDRLSAFGDGTGGLNGSTNIKSRGNLITILDWEDINIGIYATNEVKREYGNDITAQSNPIYSARMKLNPKEYDLRSKTWGVEFGDFERHLVIENFSDACPTITVSGCEPSS